MNRTLRCLAVLIAFLAAGSFQTVSAQHSVARRWNDLLIQAIREDFARPPVHARNLFHTSVVMYDAWAAYDTIAETAFLGKTWGNYTCQFTGVPVPADIEAARNKAISYAVYRLLVRRFQYSPNAFLSLGRFATYMAELGYDTNNFSTDYASGDPAALGNYLGFCMIFFSNQDGSNEQNNYAITNYSPVNQPLVMSQPGNPTMIDPNRWQPLNLPGAIDQNGNPIPAIQRFQSPEWGRVVPFAMTPADKDTFVRGGVNWYVYHDPGAPPMLDTAANGDPSEMFKWNYELVSAWGSHHDPTDGVMMDISPASVGNNQAPYPKTLAEYKDFYNLEEGGDPGIGRTINPKTGQPYLPQIVPRGDYTRVLAQFWADGPSSETPPGHWFAIFNEVMDNPLFVRKYNGKGPVLDPLQYDVKAYLTLGGAVHDAAISAWGIKGWYDNGRPATNLRYMADRGQCSDPALPHYHPAGLPLIPGYVELVQAGDPLDGGASGANIGKIKLYTWLGFDSISNPSTDIGGAGWVLAEKWWPYQRSTFVTPPFAGYVSGHSTYSRAAAEALTLLTGDEYFPGGIGEFSIGANSGFLGLEQGPSVQISLQWATYRDASDQTSLSRIWGGIHPPFDDIPGRIIGARCGTDSYYHAKELFYNDNDHDGFYSYEDCDDANATIYPGAPEICDGIDNDCNGLTDDGLSFATYYQDNDGDGYGNAAVSQTNCMAVVPSGFVDNNTDCDDTNAAIHPGAVEICDGLDNDCSGTADDGLTFHNYYFDQDGDGYGDPGIVINNCVDSIPAGYSANNLDCDDTNSAVYSVAIEVCDNIDNNCDGQIDEGLTISTYYFDEDQDGFGNDNISSTSCQPVPPVSYVTVGGDCNDQDATIYPNAPELCDELDNDCDGVVDDGLTVYTYYTDGDGDGFGNPTLSLSTCLFPAPVSFVDNNLDCNDDNPQVNPNVAEVLGDGLDNDCNGLVDSVSATHNPALSVLAFPNPVREILTIKGDFEGSMFFELANANGQLVRDGNINFVGGAANLQFSKELPGVYMLRLFDPVSNNLLLIRVVKM